MVPSLLEWTYMWTFVSSIASAQFRRDYQNWRKGGKTGAKGARGITTQAHESMSIAQNPLTELTKHTKAYPLCRKNLAKIAAVGKLKVLSSPEPPKPTAFLAHLGVGGFHRSHQAYVTDVLLERATTRSVPAGHGFLEHIINFAIDHQFNGILNFEF